MKIWLWVGAVLGGLTLLIGVVWWWWCVPGGSISGSDAQIRADILKLTPLGTPFTEAEARIHTQMHIAKFNYFPEGAPLPATYAAGGKIIPRQWPLGGEHHGREIGTIIGQSADRAGDDINVGWTFNGQDRLADVIVYRTPDAL